MCNADERFEVVVRHKERQRVDGEDKGTIDEVGEL
jgi:hypothetical protein